MRALHTTYQAVFRRGSKRAVYPVLLRYVYRRVRRLTCWLGPRYALRWLAWMRLDRLFDQRHGVDTSGVVPLQSLDIQSSNVANGVYYGPSPVEAFRAILDHLDRLRLDYSEFTFIDLGAGKGRAMLLASERPFRRIVGVEFSEQLCDVATHNINNFKSMDRRCHRLEVVCRDVAQYALPEGDLVIYIYNAFNDKILSRVVHRLEKAVSGSRTRTIYVIYLHPIFGDLLERSRFLRKQPSDEAFAVYLGEHP